MSQKNFNWKEFYTTYLLDKSNYLIPIDNSGMQGKVNLMNWSISVIIFLNLQKVTNYFNLDVIIPKMPRYSSVLSVFFFFFPNLQIYK